MFRPWLFVLSSGALAFTACAQDVARELDQERAMTIAATLRLHGVESTVKHQGESYAVRVDPALQQRAEALIVDGQLLKPEVPPQQLSTRSGLDATQGIRKREEERSAAIADALRTLPGVRDARVTLTLCENSARTHELCSNPNQLSALLVLLPNATPPDPEPLRRWLAASVPQAEDSEIAVLWSHAPSLVLEATSDQPSTTFSFLGYLVPVLVAALLTLLGGALYLRRRQSDADDDTGSTTSTSLVRT